MQENHDNCLIDQRSTRLVLEHITNKWSILILTVLCTEPCRFNELRRRLDGITHKALADALKRLERNGLVHRQVLSTYPVSVEYTITPLAQSLQQPFVALANWAQEFGPAIALAQAEYDRAHANENERESQVEA
ncbi:helix-turn-helix domain-containing protein [Kosakonia pseudosacchari]|uniref:winged helix-turn-helix transcriptional regulator n=1 Tax=Kosakonia pseudosacchari TaxID=1646340 RepID=UPI0022F0FCD4|nr:helix-turn-helix domain-containing protein [Kosakonia pseudosacchari]WBU47773.1 helix-turn-helix domain-containing protein [Kosakonia pseudosacchari]